MKKTLTIVLALVMVVALVGCGKKNIEKILSLEKAITMDEGDINSVLPGYTLDQLKEAWGTPDDSGEEKGIWYLNDMRLIVNCNWLGEVVVCGLEKSSQGQKPSNHDEKTIEAEIMNIENGSYWVNVDGENVKAPITHLSPGKEPKIGDTVKIVYSGEISKDEPGIIENVLKIYLVEDTQKTANDVAPMIDIYGQKYVAPYMPVKELPEGYTYLGDLQKEEANGTGLEGCKMYAVAELNSLSDFYLYQECGTPIDENTIDSTKLQWAYVQWVKAEPSAQQTEVPENESGASSETNEKGFTPLAPDGWNESEEAQKIYGDAEQEPNEASK